MARRGESSCRADVLHAAKKGNASLSIVAFLKKNWLSNLFNLINLLLIIIFFLYQSCQNSIFNSHQLDLNKRSLSVQERVFDRDVSFSYEAFLTSRDKFARFSLNTDPNYPAIVRTTLPCYIVNNGMRTETIVGIEFFQNEQDLANTSLSNRPKTRNKYYEELEPFISLKTGTTLAPGQLINFDIELSLLIDKEVWTNVRNSFVIGKNYSQLEAYYIFLSFGYPNYSQSEFAYNLDNKIIVYTGPDLLRNQRFIITFTFGDGSTLLFKLMTGRNQTYYAKNGRIHSEAIENGLIPLEATRNLDFNKFKMRVISIHVP